MDSFRLLFATLIGILLLTQTALAAEQLTQRSFSVWGGYFATDAAEIEGFSDGTTANLPIRNITRSDPDQGGFGGLSFGANSNALPFEFDRIDWYFEGQNTLRDSNSLSSVGVGSIPFVNGLAAGLGPVPLTAYAERERYEFGMRLSKPAHDEYWSDVAFSAFGGFGNELAVSTAVLPGFNLTTNRSELDWWFAGIMAGGERVTPIDENLDLVFGANLGGYYYDANGSIAGAHSLGSATASPSETGFGFRANAQIELRRAISHAAEISVFGGVDFWSSAPSARLNDPSLWNSQRPAGINTESLVDLSVGVKLTLKLDEQ